MSTTAHPFAPEEIMAFVDGEPSADRAQSISAHIDQCAECTQFVNQLRGVSQALTKWQVDEFPTADQKRILSSSSPSISADGLNLLPRLRIVFSRPLPWVVACVALLVVLSAQLISWRPALDMYKATAAKHKSVMETYQPSASAGRPIAPPALRGSESERQSEDQANASDNYSFSSPSTSPPTSVDRAEVSRGGRGSLGGLVERADKKTMQDAGKYLATPMIARTVTLSLVAKDFDTARQSLDAILVRHNGYAAELNVATPQGTARTIQASLRIPAAQLVAAVAELKALGRVENESQNGEEVTQQHADLLARLKNSRETEQRLQDVLRTRTGKVKDVLEVEEEIARVRGEVEQMEAEQQTLEHRVNFATIDLKLAEEYKAQLSSPAPSVGVQLRNASVNGFRNASETLLGMVLFLAESGPTLLLWLLILSFPIGLAWKRYKRQFVTI